MSNSDTAISIRGLSKAYTIRSGHKARTFGELVTSRLRNPLQRGNSETFWALKDVSFDVKHGEVVGIVGRNGAGKSTLLKLLSRVTEPTAGKISLYGRVGSLLEVGTGFHPELTGRENIFLNGTILGMRTSEIRRQFDAIADFAQVERFLDTPVKRYSSGMYVRLAFAVAAHLEPEILVVDEVLAVGDAEFQKRCLRKMSQVSQSGRAILFVSHNMQAVQSLCTRGVLLSAGSIRTIGSSADVVAEYLRSDESRSAEQIWPVDACPGDNTLRLRAMRVLDPQDLARARHSSRHEICVEMEFDIHEPLSGLCVGFDVITEDGAVVFRSYQTDLPESASPVLQDGTNRWQCRIPSGMLNSGIYWICPRIGIHNQNWIVKMDPVVSFEVTLDHGLSPYWNSLGPKSRPGVIAPILAWSAR